MHDHTSKAEIHVGEAARLAEQTNGTDTAIPLHLACAQAHALLALGDELRALGEQLSCVFAPTAPETAPRERLPHVGPGPEQKIMPCGSAGLCMAAYHPRPGAMSEFCHFPHMHTGPHSWETTLGRTE